MRTDVAYPETDVRLLQRIGFSQTEIVNLKKGRIVIINYLEFCLSGGSLYYRYFLTGRRWVKEEVK